MKPAALTLPCLAWMVLCLPVRGADVGGDFRDSFRGALAEGWSWIREDPSAWRSTERGLEIRVQPGNMWGGANNARNLLARPAPVPTERPVTVTVRIEHHPSEQYEQVDLVWYYEDSHMVKIGQEQVDGQLCVVMGREEADQTRTIAIVPLDSTTLEVRLIVRDNGVEGWFRPAGGEAWQAVGECDLPVRGEPRVCLQCYQGPGDRAQWARLSDFRMEMSAEGEALR